MKYLTPSNIRISCKQSGQITINTDDASYEQARAVIVALQNLCGLEVFFISESSAECAIRQIERGNSTSTKFLADVPHPRTPSNEFLVGHSQFGITTAAGVNELALELGRKFEEYDLTVKVFTLDAGAAPTTEAQAEAQEVTEVEAAGGRMLFDKTKKNA